jgi:hypothetical protein
MAKRPPHKTRRRPGFFFPVATRARCDCWSFERQCRFLAHLYFTGSVAAAARAVGMSRESAHRLRTRADGESFASAWDRVLAAPGSGRCTPAKPDYRKVTTATLRRRVVTGRLRPVIYRGRITAIAVKPDNTTLLRLLRRLDASAARVGPEAAEW